MVNVDAEDGIRYGFNLLKYLLLVFLASAFIMVIGGAITESSAILGGLIALVGFIVMTAGFAGLQYKIISDGVERGVRAANNQPLSGPGAQPTARQQQAGGQRRQRDQTGNRQQARQGQQQRSTHRSSQQRSNQNSQSQSGQHQSE